MKLYEKVLKLSDIQTDDAVKDKLKVRINWDKINFALNLLNIDKRQLISSRIRKHYIKLKLRINADKYLSTRKVLKLLMNKKVINFREIIRDFN